MIALVINCKILCLVDVSAEIKATIQVFVNAVAEDKPENAATIFADDCVILDQGNKVNKGKEGEC